MRFLRAKRGIGLTGLLAVAIAYPFIAYAALGWASPRAVAAVLALVLALRLAVTLRRGAPSPSGWAAAAALGGVVALAAFDGIVAIKAYPILISLALATLFAFSLAHPPTAIERMARLTGPLDDKAVAYTRKVTIAWLVFFLGNAAVSLWTTVQSLEIWALYNGLLSYLLIGALFVIEYLIRQRVLNLGTAS